MRAAGVKPESQEVELAYYKSQAAEALPGFTVEVPSSTSSSSGVSSPSALTESLQRAPLTLSKTDDPNTSNFISPDTPHSPVTLLDSQPSRYLVTRLYQQTYLLHPKDIITIPRLLPTPPLGAKLHLSRILEVGSRDFALKAPDGKRLANVACYLTVLEHTKAPIKYTVFKKRRKGYTKRVKNRHHYTRLRVSDMHVTGTDVMQDQVAPERRLDRMPTRPFDEYSATDMNFEARVARKFGLVRKMTPDAEKIAKRFLRDPKTAKQLMGGTVITEGGGAAEVEAPAPEQETKA